MSKEAGDRSDAKHIDQSFASNDAKSEAKLGSTGHGAKEETKADDAGPGAKAEAKTSGGAGGGAKAEGKSDAWSKETDYF